MTFRMYGTPEATLFDMICSMQYGRPMTAHEVLDGFAAAMAELVEEGTLAKSTAEEVSTRAGLITKKWLDDEVAQKANQASETSVAS